jgi:hypothetical protein
VSKDLHSALKVLPVGEFSAEGINFKHVRLQHGRESFTETLHAKPTGWSTYGIQATDFLHFLDFSRSQCVFHQGECYCVEISPLVSPAGLGDAVGSAFEQFRAGSKDLENCGIHIRQPEGWGYFFGRQSGTSPRHGQIRSDGHTAQVSKRLKESEDEFFRFVFTWIEATSVKGWITHYRAMHMPLSDEFHAVLAFLGGFSWFADCPEFGFDGCWWRGTAFKGTEHDLLHTNADSAHKAFDAHAARFSAGVRGLLAANAIVEPFGLSILRAKSPGSGVGEGVFPDAPRRTRRDGSHRFDVAVSFAGPEREYAEELAVRARAAGLEVFYDDFYIEQLWGKDLVAFFDRVFRKEARYCVMFISKEYAARMWCIVERRSALARLAEDGDEYVLPIRIDDTDIDGLPPTIGHISLREHSIEEIADLLSKKLRRKARR